MNKKVIPIPIYGSQFTVFKDVSVEEMCSHFGHAQLRGFDGGVFQLEDEDGVPEYALVLDKGADAGIIAHECLHLTNHILSDIGAHPTFDNDEPQAYLLGWMVNRVTEFCNEKPAS